MILDSQQKVLRWGKCFPLQYCDHLNSKHLPRKPSLKGQDPQMRENRTRVMIYSFLEAEELMIQATAKSFYLTGKPCLLSPAVTPKGLESPRLAIGRQLPRESHRLATLAYSLETWPSWQQLQAGWKKLDPRSLHTPVPIQTFQHGPLVSWTKSMSTTCIPEKLS